MNRRTRGNALAGVGLSLVVAALTVLPVGEQLLFGVGIVYALVGVAVVAAETGCPLTTVRVLPVALLAFLTPVGVRVSVLVETRPELRVFGPTFTEVVFVDPTVLVWLVVALSPVYTTLSSPAFRQGLVALAALPFVYVGSEGFGYAFNAMFYGIAFVLAVVASVPVYLAFCGLRRHGTDRRDDRPTTS